MFYTRQQNVFFLKKNSIGSVQTSIGTFMDEMKRVKTMKKAVESLDEPFLKGHFGFFRLSEF